MTAPPAPPAPSATDRESSRAPSDILSRQRSAFLRDGPPSAGARKQSLLRLKQLLHDHQADFVAAVSADFSHRSPHETVLADLYTTIAGIQDAVKHLASWMRPERRPVALHFLPGRARVLHQPLGVVGIVSPWNYPVNLALAPLTAAIAAGNRVMLKPSEYTPKTSALMASVLAEGFTEEQVAVITGGPEVGAAFTRLPFDHLFFTGSTGVGRAVMKAASDNLVPVTLELGGKSPVLIDADFPLDKAALSVAHGKLFNAGQTCIAPDYVLLPEGEADRFVELFKTHAKQLFPRLGDNPDYSAMVSKRHYDRMQTLVADALAKGARVVEVNPADEDLGGGEVVRKFAPTLLLDVDDTMTAMQDEIFGPVLPIRTYRSFDEAIGYINAHPRPLALYYFGQSRARQEAVLTRTTSGGVTINDTLLHFLQEDLPFGGVGASGMGAYHGRDGFETFSHRKAVFRQSGINTSSLLRPPYTKLIERIVAFLGR